jgi:hypothetical protein
MGFEERDTLVPLLTVVDIFAGLRALPGAAQLLARIRTSGTRLDNQSSSWVE